MKNLTIVLTDKDHVRHSFQLSELFTIEINEETPNGRFIHGTVLKSITPDQLKTIVLQNDRI
jgi:hypothetical protein